MKFTFAEEQSAHDPAMFLSAGAARANPEVPERINRLLSGAKDAGLQMIGSQNHGLSAISAVHSPEYLEFLQVIYGQWQQISGASNEVIPNIHPNRRDFSYPESPIGRAGYHMADTACPIAADTWASAYWSAQTAIEATKLVQSGEPAAYALCRPPGHHAYEDMAGGFCFLNNSAIAAQLLRESHDRVVILDVDLHHGNGTQGIFYHRRDVMTVSIHIDPAVFYPFFWGYASERGHGAGLGYNYNLPLRRGSGNQEFLDALDLAIDRIRAYQPGALVLALGLDASEHDPFGGFTVNEQGFTQIAQKCANLNLPTVIVQEGGYICDQLGGNLTSFLKGFGG